MYRCKTPEIETEMVIAFFQDPKSIYAMMEIVPLCAIEDMVCSKVKLG